MAFQLCCRALVVPLSRHWLGRQCHVMLQDRHRVTGRYSLLERWGRCYKSIVQCRLPHVPERNSSLPPLHFFSSPRSVALTLACPLPCTLKMPSHPRLHLSPPQPEAALITPAPEHFPLKRQASSACGYVNGDPGQPHDTPPTCLFMEIGIHTAGGHKGKTTATC